MKTKAQMQMLHEAQKRHDGDHDLHETYGHGGRYQCIILLSIFQPPLVKRSYNPCVESMFGEVSE